MEIDLFKVKKAIKKIDKIEKKYEEVYLTYYNTANEIDNEWNNKYEKMLMQAVEEEKKEMNLVRENMSEIKKVYSYILEKYSELGEKIKINLRRESEITDQIDKCVAELKTINNLSNNINIEDFSPQQLYALEISGPRIRNMITDLVDVKSRITSTLKNIKNIEEAIKNRINNIELVTAKETDISGMLEP